MINGNDIRIQFICDIYLLLFLIYIFTVSYQFLSSSNSSDGINTVLNPNWIK